MRIWPSRHHKARRLRNFGRMDSVLIHQVKRIRVKKMTNQNASQYDEEEILKRVAYYESLLNAWLSSRFESNKQLTTLSSLGLGLLVINGRHHGNELIYTIWLYAGAAFTGSIIINLIILYLNSSYIESIVSNDENTQSKLVEKLSSLSVVSYILFGIGVLATFLYYALGHV